MNEFLRKNRQRIELDLIDSPSRHLFSPVALSQQNVTFPMVKKYANGRLIDLGCGFMPYKKALAGQIEIYDSLDLFPKTPEVTYTADIQDMRVIQDCVYDSALCIEVLEHVPDPLRASREISRILKPEGYLILSVPHLSRLHEEPYDFYRFTKYGLQVILEQAGFRIVDLRARGGLLSFIGHQVSTIFLGFAWGIPVVKDIAWFLNSWLVTRPCYFLDRSLWPNGVFAQGYSVVAQKR